MEKDSVHLVYTHYDRVILDGPIPASVFAVKMSAVA